ncbi:hypothetical protein FHY05_002773 [Sphingomonas sp. BK580]|nr:hypothetical protein [Sphingomonas sp. BK580]
MLRSATQRFFVRAAPVPRSSGLVVACPFTVTEVR